MPACSKSGRITRTTPPRASVWWPRASASARPARVIGGRQPRAVDAFDAKGDALGLVAQLGLTVDNLQVATEAPGWYHPGRSGVIKLGPKTVLARFGELHPRALEALDIKGPAVAFEVFLDALPAPKAKSSKARPLLKAFALPAGRARISRSCWMRASPPMS